MPRRPRRLLLPEYGVFHVTCRGVDGMDIVRDDLDRRRWVGLRRASFDRFEIAAYVWCLLTNHCHFVVEGRRDSISKALHRLNGIYAQRFNSRHDRTGHLFQQRPDIRLLGDDEYLENACAYVRANPVRASLCAEPSDWPWTGQDLWIAEEVPAI